MDVSNIDHRHSNDNMVNVIAGSWIAPNCRSAIFHLHISRLLTILETPVSNTCHDVKISATNGNLSPLIISDLNNNEIENDNATDWLNHVKLASNCFEQNLIAFPATTYSSCSTSHHHHQYQLPVFFIVVKSIEPGEQLRFWPWIGLSMQLGIPAFLSPNNIINDHCYICHQCGRSYSQPNPLKIHLMLTCPSVKEKPIFENNNNNNVNYNRKISPTTFQQTMNKWMERKHLKLDNSKRFIMNESTDAMASSTMSITSPISTATTMTTTTTTTTTATTTTTMMMTTITDMSNNNNNNNVNLSRRLHTCSYCGKVYTRKYGLKIHIRTHTGVKPLSCRYCGRSFSDPSNLNKHMRLHTQHSTLQQQQQQQQQSAKNRDQLSQIIRHHHHIHHRI
ncbi:PR domain zinc finger protein 13 [Dermatophagoides farinae]|uniref:PR domain zinc finger protein 13 n=1 Tax=Dermatophagoides farinae TaxID=6954 RepID=A0A922HW27_DERFA|nr:PR domain zinc finger protein 13 [Dermatophagoides farinae]